MATIEENSHLRTGGPDAPERSSDSDFIARIGKVIERYKIFWIVVMALFAWWSREVVIPLRESAQTTGQVRILNVKMDSTVIPWLIKGDADRQQIIDIQEGQARILGTLTRLQCLRTSLVDRAKIDLSCKDIPIEFPTKTGGL